MEPTEKALRIQLQQSILDRIDVEQAHMMTMTNWFKDRVVLLAQEKAATQAELERLAKLPDPPPAEVANGPA